MAKEHLDKRTVEAWAPNELSVLEPLAQPGLSGLRVRFKIARIQAGLSQLWLALEMRDVGFPWDKKRVWMVEKGISSPRADELYAVAKVLKCDPVWLFHGGAGSGNSL